jgi:hypothetical protein
MCIYKFELSVKESMVYQTCAFSRASRVDAEVLGLADKDGSLQDVTVL